jgi:hypothetical protein
MIDFYEQQQIELSYITDLVMEKITKFNMCVIIHQSMILIYLYLMNYQ